MRDRKRETETILLYYILGKWHKKYIRDIQAYLCNVGKIDLETEICIN